MRWWDKDRANINRYWFNIPAVLWSYQTLMPEYTQIVYISPDIKQHTLYNVLEMCVRHLGIIVEEIDVPYSKSEPIMWRHKPIFDLSNEVVLPRDLDSMPTSWDVKNSLFFDRSDYKMSTMKSHEHHVGMSMLGGLSGFKPSISKDSPSWNKSFDSYYSEFNDSREAVDQVSMTTNFIHNNDLGWLRNNFVEFSKKGSTTNFSARLVLDSDEDYNSFNVLDENNIFEEIDPLSTWSGEPCDVRGKLLTSLLSKNEMGQSLLADMIKDRMIKNFYKI
jgi:hypothetical protein